MIELKDTIKGMTSEDYKERFIAEYQQTNTRYLKLKNFCDRIELAEVHGVGVAPDHDCPLTVFVQDEGSTEDDEDCEA